MYSGGDLFSQGVAPQVSSARTAFTTVFGMGTGGTPSLRPPETGVSFPTKRGGSKIFVCQPLGGEQRASLSARPSTPQSLWRFDNRSTVKVCLSSLSLLRDTLSSSGTTTLASCLHA